MATTEPAEIRGQISELLTRSLRLLRVVLVGAWVIVALLMLLLAGILRITSETNTAVHDQVEVLQDRNDELESQVDDLEAVNKQAVDEVVRLATEMQAAGLDPGTIRIEPPDEGD